MWLHRGTELGLVSPRGWSTDDGSTCLETADLSQFRILSVVWDGNFFLIGLPKVKLDVMLKAPGKSLNVRWKLISVGLCINPVSRLVRCYCAHFTNKKKWRGYVLWLLAKGHIVRGRAEPDPVSNEVHHSTLLPDTQQHSQLTSCAAPSTILWFHLQDKFLLKKDGYHSPYLIGEKNWDSETDHWTLFRAPDFLLVLQQPHHDPGVF